MFLMDSFYGTQFFLSDHMSSLSLLTNHIFSCLDSRVDMVSSLRASIITSCKLAKY
jgi:hypothetical protein